MKHLPAFCRSCFHLFFFRLRISVVDCRRHILPRNHYRTNEASFNPSLMRNSGQYVIFITAKSCFNTVTLEIFLSREHLSCLESTPNFAKLYGCWQRVKQFSSKIFVLNNSAFQLVLLKIAKHEALLSPRGWNRSVFLCKNILFPVRKILTADFERVFTVCALARFTKLKCKTFGFVQ